MDKLIFHDGCHFEFLTLSERLDMPVSTFSLAFGVLCESRDGTHKLFFFNKTFIKNGFHDTIHTFKNYFTTVFSVFSNKRYSNKP